MEYLNIGRILRFNKRLFENEQFLERIFSSPKIFHDFFVEYDIDPSFIIELRSGIFPDSTEDVIKRHYDMLLFLAKSLLLTPDLLLRFQFNRGIGSDIYDLGYFIQLLYFREIEKSHRKTIIKLFLRFINSISLKRFISFIQKCDADKILQTQTEESFAKLLVGMTSNDVSAIVELIKAEREDKYILKEAIINNNIEDFVVLLRYKRLNYDLSATVAKQWNDMHYTEIQVLNQLYDESNDVYSSLPEKMLTNEDIDIDSSDYSKLQLVYELQEEDGKHIPKVDYKMLCNALIFSYLSPLFQFAFLKNFSTDPKICSFIQKLSSELGLPLQDSYVTPALYSDSDEYLKNLEPSYEALKNTFEIPILEEFKSKYLESKPVKKIIKKEETNLKFPYPKLFRYLTPNQRKEALEKLYDLYFSSLDIDRNEFIYLFGFTDNEVNIKKIKIPFNWTEKPGKLQCIMKHLYEDEIDYATMDKVFLCKKRERKWSENFNKNIKTFEIKGDIAKDLNLILSSF